ncbi:MAG: sulfite exporter TauE/SafE family protein [Pseudomonadales bacterium]|nr:sulfite exporter TauE/SafE family protein [Pseudomonadales bacterium]MCP5172787.1 sulfite exporter TauE/SafE family protein [Pseudomonadales bacterium]MCP5302261.1 sulfite exporter TauE/SafE family protein [Pseudomonadales bacterium]
METYLFFMLLGAVAGLSAGLLGVGGGVVMVPSLILGFSSQGFPPEVLTHMAVATSLAAMVVTAASSAFAHNKLGSVDWFAVRWMASGVLLGALVGVVGSLQLKGAWIQVAFGIFLMAVGLRVFIARNNVKGKLLPGPFGLAAAGSVIGAVSMVFGIGGGSMTVPLLMRYGLAPKQAMGSSAALGLPIAVLGGVLYALGGRGDQILPEFTLGYVYLPAFAGLVLLGIPFAKLGANVAHRLPERQLKRVFGGYAMLVGALLLVRNLL